MAVAGVLILTLRRPPEIKAGDFLLFLYPAGKQVLHGHLRYVLVSYHIWDNLKTYPYPDPPFTAVLLAAFAWLPMKTAAVAWWLFGGALTALTAALLAARLAAARQARFAFAGAAILLFASFAPLASALSSQLDVWVMAPIAGAFVLCTKSQRLPRHLFAGGMLLGVAAAIRVYPVATLALIVWLRRSEARMLLLGAATAVIASIAVPLALLGSGPLIQYVHVLTSHGNTFITAVPQAFGFLNIADRALVATPFSINPFHLSPTVPKLMYAAFVGAVLVYVSRRFRAPKAREGSIWVVALLTTAAVSPWLEFEHLTTLALAPVLLLADEANTDSRHRMSWHTWIAPLALACFICSAISLPGHSVWADIASVSVAVVAGAYVARGRAPLSGVFAAAFILLAAPAFGVSSILWGMRPSLLHVVLGSAEFVFLLAMLASIGAFGGARTQHQPSP